MAFIENVLNRRIARAFSDKLSPVNEKEDA